YSIVAVEIETADRIGVADGTMMRVAKKQNEAAAPRPPLSEPSHHPRLVPFVDDDDIRPGNACFQVGKGIVIDGLQLRISGTERIESARPVIFEQIFEAPAGARLAGHRFVTQRDQLTKRATKKMRISVIPARGKRMREINDPHARTSLPALRRFLDSRPP